MSSRHRAWAEIDLEAFRSNLRYAANLATPAAVWPVLKANAYGHGAKALARVCAAEGVARLGVGDSSEALELRESRVFLPTLILGTVIDAEVPALLQHDIEVGVHSESRARMLGKAAHQARRVLGVHLKVDTGMGRLGMQPEAVARVAQTIAAEPYLELRGMMTHFASLQGFLDPATTEQQRSFETLVSRVRDLGIRVPAIHCMNSAALFTCQSPYGDAVRPGMGLYGALPTLPKAKQHPLQPVMAVRTQIVFMKDVPAGTAVGYGGLWKAKQPTRLAVLPMGYCDGIPYRLGLCSTGDVLIRGRRCPLVGAISMDYSVADVTHLDGAQTGDTVTFIGQDGAENISVSEIAAQAGTIPYEITCSIGARVRRVYLTEAQKLPPTPTSKEAVVPPPARNSRRDSAPSISS